MFYQREYPHILSGMTVERLIVPKCHINNCLCYEKLNRVKFINFAIYLFSPSVLCKQKIKHITSPSFHTDECSLV